MQGWLCTASARGEWPAKEEGPAREEEGWLLCTAPAKEVGWTGREQSKCRAADVSQVLSEATALPTKYGYNYMQDGYNNIYKRATIIYKMVIMQEGYNNIQNGYNNIQNGY